MRGTLYIVPTPIGNLEDITLRALRVLEEVDLIAAEDTRHSRKLLSHFKIGTPMVSYHDHVEHSRAPRLIEKLEAGNDVALISDAGTPSLADPGYRLIAAAVAAGVRVVPLPGASAISTALSASGLPSDRFTFEGFVPSRAAARVRFFEDLVTETRTIVCFEAGRRIVAALNDLVDVMGSRQIVVAREMTKMYEEFSRGSIEEVLSRIEGQPVRGEVTVLIHGAEAAAAMSEEEIRTAIRELRDRGLRIKEVSRRLAAASGIPAREIYRIGLEIEKEQ
jgi:16S rRNA (cytidine1402-2'-O)-methyltransferase